MRSVRIGVISPHPLLRAGLVHHLAARPEFEIVVEGRNWDDAARLVAMQAADTYILDAQVPLSLKPFAVAVFRDVGAIVLVDSGDLSHIEAVLGDDRFSLVSAGVSDRQIVDCLVNFRLRRRYVGPDLARSLLRHNRRPAALQQARLTERELHVASSISRGETNKVIARQLGISEKTVKYHVTAILQKLHLRSRVGVARWVHQELGARLFA